MLERRFGDMTEGDGERSGVFSSKRKGEVALKFRGDVLSKKGEEFSVYGLLSRETIIFCEQDQYVFNCKSKAVSTYPSSLVVRR